MHQLTLVHHNREKSKAEKWKNRNGTNSAAIQ